MWCASPEAPGQVSSPAWLGGWLWDLWDPSRQGAGSVGWAGAEATLAPCSHFTWYWGTSWPPCQGLGNPEDQTPVARSRLEMHFPGTYSHNVLRESGVARVCISACPQVIL